MIRISRLADYAVMILASMNEQPEALVTAGAVSGNTGLPEPTAAKVLKLLCKGGLLLSVRGAGGGYKLAGAAENITVAQIVTAVDGPVALTACVDAEVDCCDYQTCCPVKGRWDSVNDAVKNALDGVTLSDMTAQCCDFKETKTV